MEARKVYPMVNLALAQRAVWIQDVSLAVFGDEAKVSRLKELTAGILEDAPQGLTEEQELKNLRALSRDLSGKQAADLAKQVDFLDYCRKRGITW